MKPGSRHIRTVIASGVLAIALSIGIAACGSSGGSSGTEAAQATPAFKCTMPAAQNHTTVHFYGWSFPTMTYYANELKACGSGHNISVTTDLTSSATVDQQVPLALGGGSSSPYDILHASNPEINQWANNGWLVPLNAMIKKYQKQYHLSNISSSGWKAATVNGKIYGVPLDANTLDLAYRADLLKKYHIAVPTSYDDVISDCAKIKHSDPGVMPFAFDLSAGWAWETEFYSFLRSYGGKYANADGTAAFDSPAGVAALTKLKQVADACMGASNLTNYGETQNDADMENGSLVMTQIWASQDQSMVDPKSSHYPSDVKFAPGPAPKSGGSADGSAWNDFYVIPRKSRDDPNLLFRLIMQVAGQQSQQGAAPYGIVTRAAVAQKAPGSAAALTTIRTGAGSYPNVAAIPAVQTALGNFLPLVGNGKMSPQAALAAAKKQYTSVATKKGLIKK